MKVKVIGAGLAGSEAAWQLANRGIEVELYEMKPKKMTPAHHSPGFAELVCSNSLRGAGLATAPGLLKEELRRCGRRKEARQESCSKKVRSQENSGKEDDRKEDNCQETCCQEDSKKG